MNLSSAANPVGGKEKKKKNAFNKLDLVLLERAQSGPGNGTNNYQ